MLARDIIYYRKVISGLQGLQQKLYTHQSGEPTEGYRQIAHLLFQAYKKYNVPPLVDYLVL